MRPSSFSKLATGFIRLARDREKRLPSWLAENTIHDLLAQKEVLLESASLLGTPQYFFDETSLSSSVDRFDHAFSSNIRHLRLFYT
jgi:hypothetical protein